MAENEEHNRSIMATKYFTINDAIKCPMKSPTAFIIANERTTKDGHIGRYYTVFPTFTTFLTNRAKYKHCHELLVDHIRSKSNPAGRLVFDFDIKDVTIPNDFKDQIEDVVIDVLARYFKDLDIDKIEFIWSTSENPNKFSKHLTVKHLYFDNWIRLSKIFYRLFCIVWDETHFWIRSRNLIDFQIVRNNGSLRMVGSSKINGYPLNFDNEKHTLTDSLIRIYYKKHREAEQLVTDDNINETVFSNVLHEKNDDDDNEPDLNSTKNITIKFDPNKIIKPLYINDVYIKAYEIYNKINPGVFKMGKISGDRISLIRIKPYRCLLSGKRHDQENAFCCITKGDEFYSIYFGCYRYCHSEKYVQIGSISTNKLIVFINPNFEPPTKMKRKKQESSKKRRIIEI